MSLESSEDVAFLKFSSSLEILCKISFSFLFFPSGDKINPSYFDNSVFDSLNLSVTIFLILGIYSFTVFI